MLIRLVLALLQLLEVDCKFYRISSETKQAYRAEHWEEWSLIRNDEAPEIFGHMQGLSIVTGSHFQVACQKFEFRQAH